jgi:membrane fusion protein (multidrug efflux system)
MPMLLASCIALSACGGEAESAAGATPGRSDDERRVVPVEVSVAQLGTAARSVMATGTVEPIRSVGINSQLSGSVLRVTVEEGDRVAPGTLLAQLDSRELEAQLASADAALEVARRAAERAERLREQRITTEAEYERDQAALTAARAARDQLRTRIGFATVRAPIAGVVVEKRVERGDIVGAQSRLFTIADVSTLVVRVPVSELDVTALRAGASADVTLDALPGRDVSGRIRRIFPAADTASRLVPVEVALIGAGARAVKPGFLARVRFHLDPRENVLMVPDRALIENSGGSAVFVVRGDQAALRRVRRGGTYDGRVEILDGIAAGDTVVVAGNTMLRDGATVRVVPAAVPAASDSMIGARMPRDSTRPIGVSR